MSRPSLRRRDRTRLARLRCPTVLDVWGDRWVVAERRPTKYKFSICMGWPHPDSGSHQSGKAAVIVTKSLAAHVRANAQRPYYHPLPISDNAFRRVRQLLGVDHRAWTDIRISWWLDRLDDLGALSSREFAEKHQPKAWTRSGAISTTLVWKMRVALLGRVRRPVGWWRLPDVQKAIMSDQPVHVIAKKLRITHWMVYGVRQRVRRQKRRVR